VIRDISESYRHNGDWETAVLGHFHLFIA